MNLLRELYDYRTMITSLVKKNLKSRYKGSVLGFLWTFLIPLLQLVVYTLVFSLIMKTAYEKYYLFLFVALIPWVFFSSSITEGTGVICTNKDLVNKIYFPREVLPISHVSYLFVNMLLSFIVVLGVILVTGHGFNPVALLFLPIVMIVEYFLALGITMLLSALNVYFRDLEYIMGIVMMAWQFLSPVMYDTDIVPENLLVIFNLNPMSPIIQCYRDILYYKRIPTISTLGISVLVGVVFLIIGTIVFGKLKKRFSEAL